MKKNFKSEPPDELRNIMLENAIQGQLANQKKSVGVFVVLALLLGVLGAHRAYMGEPGWMLAYIFGTVVCAPLVLIIVLVEICMSSKTIKKYNENLEKEIRAKTMLTYCK